MSNDFTNLSKAQKTFLKQLAREACMANVPMSKKAFIKRLAARGLVYWMVQDGEIRVSIGGDAYGWASKLV